MTLFYATSLFVDMTPDAKSVVVDQAATQAQTGTPDKIKVLRDRATSGLRLYVPEDNTDCGAIRPSQARKRPRWLGEPRSEFERVHRLRVEHGLAITKGGDDEND